MTSTDQRSVSSYTSEIVPEVHPSNPRTWRENSSSMICFHGRLVIGDDTSLTHDMFSGWDDLKQALQRDFDAKVLVPVGLIDHSSLALYDHAGPHAADPQGWDSGQIGWIFMTDQQIKDTLEVAAVGQQAIEQATGWLSGEIAAYSMYLSGDVWSVTIRDEDGEIVDSVGDVYGREDAEQEARTMLEELTAV